MNDLFISSKADYILGCGKAIIGRTASLEQPTGPGWSDLDSLDFRLVRVSRFDLNSMNIQRFCRTNNHIPSNEHDKITFDLESRIICRSNVFSK